MEEGWRFMTGTDWSRAHAGLLGAEEFVVGHPASARSIIAIIYSSQ